jgi:hypothetical protein
MISRLRSVRTLSSGTRIVPVGAVGVLSVLRGAIRIPYAANGSGTDMAATTQKTLLRTSDLTEAVDAVSRVYSPREVQIRGRNRG